MPTVKESIVIEIVIVASVTDAFQVLVNGLKSSPEVRISWVKTSAAALELASDSTPGLMIIADQMDDKSGLDLAREVIMVNAGINMAVLSDRPADEFHAASEGLGILAQLPTNPGTSEAERLLDLIKKI